MKKIFEYLIEKFCVNKFIVVCSIISLYFAMCVSDDAMYVVERLINNFATDRLLNGIKDIFKTLLTFSMIIGSNIALFKDIYILCPGIRLEDSMWKLFALRTELFNMASSAAIGLFCSYVIILKNTPPDTFLAYIWNDSEREILLYLSSVMPGLIILGIVDYAWRKDLGKYPD